MMTINGVYHVYDAGISVQQGGATYVNWSIPMLASSV
jgi:hypothetical protein